MVNMQLGTKGNADAMIRIPRARQNFILKCMDYMI